MDKIIIHGGYPLSGTIAISGAKNGALPLIAASLLSEEPQVLHNFPDLRDTRTILALLAALGVVWEKTGTSVTINAEKLDGYEASYDLVKTMRASVLVLGPLLARLGRARVSLPGGCAIGARPIDFHLHGFEKLGVKITLKEGYVDAVVQGKLQGADICFDTPSVTGTENILMAAVLANGTTVIKNAAREPEIANLIDMLIAMGGKIEGRNSGILIIHGVKKLHGAQIDIIPDRIETGTYLTILGAAGGTLTLTNCNPSHLGALLDKLRGAGVQLETNGTTIHASRSRDLCCVDIKTMPYPGFPTDLQAQLMALMTCAKGLSVINETIFENRFMHVAELKRMGADIRVNGHSAIVTGVNRLNGAQVMATDLRASASLVVAGLAAEGVTEISRIYHLDRGYDNLVEKLTGVGAQIARHAE